MRKTITARIVQADVPNSNNRVYPRETLEAAIKNIPNDRLFAQIGMPTGTSVDLSEIAAAVGNFAFDDQGYLTAEIVPMGTPKGKVLKGFLDENIEFDYRPAGVGNIDANGVVSNFRFVSIGVLAKGTGA